MTRTSPLWLRVLAVILVLVVVVSSFALSFTVLRDLAVDAGIPASVGWLWPVVVDGTITAATLMLYTGRSNKMPMVTLIIFGLASVIGNVAHILMARPSDMSWVIPAFVGLIPPVGLLMTVELLGGLLRSEDKAEPVDTPVAEIVVPVVAMEARTAGTVANGGSTDDVDGEPDVAADTPVAAAEVVVATPDPVAPADDTPVTTDVDEGDTDLDTVTEAEPSVEVGPVAGVADAPTSVLVDQVAQVHRLHAVEQLPDSPSEQIDWIVRKARAGVDLSSWKTLAQLFEDAGIVISSRTVQRRLADAKKQEPELFKIEAVS